MIRYVETRRWDWPWVRRSMLARHTDGEPKRPIGFGASTNGKSRLAGQPR